MALPPPKPPAQSQMSSIYDHWSLVNSMQPLSRRTSSSFDGREALDDDSSLDMRESDGGLNQKDSKRLIA
ncbi:hypothetical protein GUJ93_ZPchr0004g38913 [Zizania palustris]|uniref:Uncharacterized protein n=1 Tax=Zizania palustris TaxID=103762 RepID=A0A8J5RZA3_ZIZPA|nr:hypothetical protein GUJ93_ZPchr0004g38913 [Zizania palustris]